MQRVLPVDREGKLGALDQHSYEDGLEVSISHGEMGRL